MSKAPGNFLVAFPFDGELLVDVELLGGRSNGGLPHLVSTVNELAARGVEFRSVRASIDTTTAGGSSFICLRLYPSLKRS